MTYIPLSDIYDPSPLSAPPAGWGDQVGENLDFLWLRGPTTCLSTDIPTPNAPGQLLYFEDTNQLVVMTGVSFDALRWQKGQLYVTQGAGTDWGDASVVIDGIAEGRAAITLRVLPHAAQIRLGDLVNDLYFRNDDDSTFIALQASAFTVGSSTRFKDDVQDLELDALDVVRDLEPKSWVPHDVSRQERRIGFTAEDMVDTFPAAVVVDEEGLPSGLDLTALLTLALTAIQKLTARLDALEGS